MKQKPASHLFTSGTNRLFRTLDVYPGHSLIVIAKYLRAVPLIVNGNIDL